MKSTLKFNERYRERVRLASGELVSLRLVCPGDKGLLENGFNNLSALSRQKRFFGGKRCLSETELRYLTELDQIDHFALGVVELNPQGEEAEGIAVGRFIRLAGGADTAEVALTVVDRMQGKGIGRLLLEKLEVAAVERGIKKLRFEILPQNREMQNLVRNVLTAVTFTHQDGVTIAESDIGARHPAADKVLLPVSYDFGRMLRELNFEVLLMQIQIGSKVTDRSWYDPVRRKYQKACLQAASQ